MLHQAHSFHSPKLSLIHIYIEQQKTLANKKYRQIIEQAAANTTAAQEKVNIAKISSENAQKEVYRLRFALLIANYYQQILQDKYRKDNDLSLIHI